MTSGKGPPIYTVRKFLYEGVLDETKDHFTAFRGFAFTAGSVFYGGLQAKRDDYL